MSSSFGGTIKLQGESEYRKALKQISQNLTEVTSEMKIVNATYDKSDNSINALTSRNEVLNKKLDEQADKVKVLGGALEDAVKEYGENSSEVKKWQTQLNNAKADVIKTTKEIEKIEKELEDLEDASKQGGNGLKELGEDAEKSSEGLKGFLGSLGGISKSIISGITGAVVGLGASLVASVEGSKEFTDNMTKLKVASESAGYSVEYAEGSFQKLYGILGDETTANTTVSNLMAMGTSTDNLNSLINSSAGIWAKFGDSIPLDGLAEAINHTGKLGSVQGNLADALEWSGITVEDFNAKLETISSEEERQQLIVDTLSATYGKLGEEYQKNNEAMISLQEAQMNMKQSISDIGTAFTPVIAMFTEFGSGLLSSVVPQIQELASAFTDLFSGVEGSEEKIGVAVSGIINTFINKIISMLPQVSTVAISILQSLITGIVNSLPTLIPAIIEVINTLVSGIVEMLPQILEAGIQILFALMQGIAEALPDLVPQIVKVIIKIMEIFNENFDTFLMLGIKVIMGLIEGLIKSIPDILKNLPTIIMAVINFFTLSKFLTLGKTIIKGLINGLTTSVPNILAEIPKLVGKIINSFKNGGWANVGKDIIRGICNGLTSMGNFILSAVKKVGKSMLGGIKSFFGIKSPSRLMQDEVGTFLAEGIGVGFEDTMEDVTKDMTNAIPTEFDTNISANMSSSTGVSGTNYDLIVSAFTTALQNVKVVMNDREFGTFVTDTMEKVVYS